MTIDETEGAECASADRYEAAMREEIRDQIDDTSPENQAWFEEKAGEIREAIDRGEVTREEIEGAWDERLQTAEQANEAIKQEWGLAERMYAGYETVKEESPEKAPDAAELQETEVRILGECKQGLYENLVTEEVIGKLRETLGWQEAEEVEGAPDDDSEVIDDPALWPDAGEVDGESGSGPEEADDAPDGESELLADFGESGVETPQYERRYFIPSEASKEEEAPSSEKDSFLDRLGASIKSWLERLSFQQLDEANAKERGEGEQEPEVKEEGMEPQEEDLVAEPQEDEPGVEVKPETPQQAEAQGGRGLKQMLASVSGSLERSEPHVVAEAPNVPKPESQRVDTLQMNAAFLRKLQAER